MKRENRYTMPFTILKHPVSGFETLKYRGLGSLRMSFLLFLAFAFLNVLQMLLMGKQFQMIPAKSVNLPLAFLSAGILLFTWTVANWCFCVLIDGKATFRNIWIISVYSLLPYTLTGYFNIFLGLVMTREEDVFRTILTAVGCLWSLVLILSAFVCYHEFEIPKAILALVLTVIGMVVIAILVFLVFSLFQQLVSNIMILVNEIVFLIKLRG